jgi:dipeptidyl aminopeptidase/acylaminoacyl peptidase
VSLEPKLFVVSAVLGWILGSSGVLSGESAGPGSQKRGVTVADAISMARIVGTPYPYISPKNGFAVFSPDGEHFAIVVAKGNLRHNTNDYSLLVFRSADIFHNATTKTLATFHCSSNRAGISEVKWLDDNNTILFLGSVGADPSQLYSIQYESRKLKRLTNHRTSLVSYGVSPKGEKIVYAADKPEKPLTDDEVLHYGFDVGSEGLSDLVRERISNYEPEVFLKRAGSLGDKGLRTQGRFDSGVNDLSVSPDGRYLLLKTDTDKLPDNWRQYNDQDIQLVLRRRVTENSSTRILHYELINLGTRKSEMLIDAPTSYSSADVLWSPDSKSVLLCGTYLPLDVEDPAELQARRTNKFVVEIRLDTGALTKITNEDLKPLRWNPQTNIVQFSSRTRPGQGEGSPEMLYYQRAGVLWQRLASVPRFRNHTQPQILVEEDLNIPPQIVAVDPETKRKTTLLTLNPKASQLAFGHEEVIQWTTNGGATMSGGLYLPPDYVAGKRYPFVIQTHGFEAHRFWIDGPYMSAFAARPLASRGIAVLQLNDIFYDTLDTPQEIDRVTSAYDSAVDYLDKKGIIDPSRVGLIGFSRTCLYVKYVLTHSARHFAAALVSDGIDAGYSQYFLFYGANPILASDFEAIIGGPPFGASLSLWLKNSPGFLLDKVETPLQIEAIGPQSILGEWQWFEGLRRLGKPVDMLFLPRGTHVLVKPWEQMASQQRTVDWFCFWLKGEEDPNPKKAGQYARWRKFRGPADSLLYE